MCLACEEMQMYYRYQLLQQIARGHMPPGLTEEDLRQMGLPLPGEITADGEKTVAGNFACDVPDGE